MKNQQYKFSSESGQHWPEQKRMDDTGSFPAITACALFPPVKAPDYLRKQSAYHPSSHALNDLIDHREGPTSVGQPALGLEPAPIFNDNTNI